ncbi:MAG TPA: hypothetical protein VJ001_13475, partial [Rhodocyclaceae bacterium]|nr:hypothetical protein [Rhodocyclaceae bacterium]
SVGGKGSYSASSRFDIVLGNAGNDLGGLVDLGGNNIVLKDDVDGLTLGTIAAAGNLSITSAGALNLGTGTVGGKLVALANNREITASGALTVAGASTVNAGTGAIQLAQVNDFQNTVTPIGGATRIVDVNDLTLEAISTGSLEVVSNGALNLGSGTVAGTLTASSNNGNIVKSGSLTVTGASIIDAGTGTVNGYSRIAELAAQAQQSDPVATNWLQPSPQLDRLFAAYLDNPLTADISSIASTSLAASRSPDVTPFATSPTFYSASSNGSSTNASGSEDGARTSTPMKTAAIDAERTLSPQPDLNNFTTEAQPGVSSNVLAAPSAIVDTATATPPSGASRPTATPPPAASKLAYLSENLSGVKTSPGTEAIASQPALQQATTSLSRIGAAVSAETQASPIAAVAESGIAMTQSLSSHEAAAQPATSAEPASNNQFATLSNAKTSSGASAFDKALGIAMANGESFDTAVNIAQQSVQQADMLARADDTPLSGLANGKASGQFSGSPEFQKSLGALLAKGLSPAEAMKQAGRSAADSEAALRADAKNPEAWLSSGDSSASSGQSLTTQLASMANAKTASGAAAFDKVLSAALAKGESFDTAVKLAQQSVQQADQLSKADNTPLGALANGQAFAQFAEKPEIQKSLGALLARGVAPEAAMKQVLQSRRVLEAAARTDENNPMSWISSGDPAALAKLPTQAAGSKVMSVALMRGVRMDKALTMALETNAREQQAIQVDHRNPEAGLANGGATELPKGDAVFDRLVSNAIARGKTPAAAIGAARDIVAKQPKESKTPAQSLASGKNLEALLGDAIDNPIFKTALGNALAKGVPIEAAIKIATQRAEASAFRFPLPTAVVQRISAKDAAFKITTAKGAPIPPWLRYVPEKRSFYASSVPEGGLPLQIAIAVNGQNYPVTITESSIRR